MKTTFMERWWDSKGKVVSVKVYPWWVLIGFAVGIAQIATAVLLLVV